MTPDKELNLENARVGYEVAVNLAMDYSQVTWSMFNAMVVANSIIVAGITYATASVVSLRTLQIAMPLLGLLLCLIWFLQAMRAISFINYYILSAREIEEKILKREIQTISRGGDFSDRKKVILFIDGRKIIKRMRFLPRLFRGEWISYFLIFVFVAVYLLSLIPIIF